MDIISSLFEVNFLAVIVAAIVQFALGALWYSNAMFAQAWMTDNNIKPGDIKQGTGDMAWRYGSTLVLFFLISWVLAALLSSASIADAVNASVVIGLGLIACSMAIHYIYENKTLRLFIINAGYNIFGLIIAAIILALWQ